MQPVYQSIAESGGASSSCEDIQSGLIYTPAYYEEEQLYSDLLEPPNEAKVPNVPKTASCVNPTVEIGGDSTVNIDLPPILWHGYKNIPKILCLANTGRTILINGQWVKGRPYIEGGPLNGTYIFSQIHFHSPSEHQIAGKRYPLEMHVVHYKTSYLTQERAMHEKDGTVVLVYLFQVVDECQNDLGSVTKLAPKIGKVNSQIETKDVPLQEIVKPFTSNYYVYWGSVATGKSTYLLQWIVNGSLLSVTKQEADELLGIMNFDGVNIKNVPRLKPENNAIYYVEEIQQEQEKQEEIQQEQKKQEEFQQEQEKQEEFQQTEENPEDPCSTCRSYQEWWLSHCSHAYANNDSNDAAQYEVLPESMLHGFCKREEDCHSQPTLSSRKSRFTNRNYSGLRICCHQMRKPIKCRQKPTKNNDQPCNLPVSSSSKRIDCPEENSERKEVIIVKETASCPSVSKDAQVVECTEIPECPDIEEVNLKVACSCPSVKNSVTSMECKREKKVKTKKNSKTDCCITECKVSPSTQSNKSKRSSKDVFKSACKASSSTQGDKVKYSSKDVSKNVCTGSSSSQSTKSKQSVKKKDKKKEESCDDEPPCGRPSSGKKERRSSTPKRTRKNSDPDSDKSCSKLSNKKSKGKASKNEVAEDCKYQDIPVECIIATVPEKSFNEILREYDTTWLDDSKFKFSKTDSKLSDDLSETIKSADGVSTKLSKNPHSEPDNNVITTIFEKKREPKVLEPTPEDCTVNFLLKPNSRKSYPSSSFMSPKSISEEIKCFENKVSNKAVNVPDITVNTVTVSGVRIPAEKSNESPKEFCVQVELLFHSNNKNFSECVTQEYNLALMYNQNILQEYTGTLCPSNLQVGNYEKLELLPKYPELENISIRLQDCTVRMDSSDQLCMRAKFLMKELNFKNLDELFGEQKVEDSRDKKILLPSDAVTQCSGREFDKISDFDILEKLSLQAKVSEFPQRPVTTEGDTPWSSRVNFATTKSQSSHQSLDQKNMKTKIFINQNSGTKPDDSKTSAGRPCVIEEVEEDGSKKSKNSEENRKKLNSSDEASDERKDTRGKEFAKKAVKELKNIFSNRKKTVYFMYEKVERDEDSGKKVFVGSFRSKDDMKDIHNDKKSLSIVDSSDEDNKLFLHSSKDWDTSDEVIPLQSSNEQDLKVRSPSTSNLLNDKKDVVTLHKFKPKHLRMKDSKKESLNLVVGKALNQLEKDSKNYKRLAELVGIDQKENSKISVYELQESTDDDGPLLAEADDQKVKKASLVVVSDPVSHGSGKEKSRGTKPLHVGRRKSLSKKFSQSAVIIIPVEVQSLSKVEVILVEHSEKAKKPF